MMYGVFQDGCLLKSLEGLDNAQDWALDQPLAQPHDVLIICDASGVPVCLACNGSLWTVDDRDDDREVIQPGDSRYYDPAF